jgi:dihydrofolate reductase
LKRAEWNNSTLIKENIIEEITKLKEQGSKNDIGVSGSGSLVQTLMRHGLVDELLLLVYPVVLGTGKRLFSDGMTKSTLKLVETRPLSSGVALLRYLPERQDR